MLLVIISVIIAAMPPHTGVVAWAGYALCAITIVGYLGGSIK